MGVLLLVAGTLAATVSPWFVLVDAALGAGLLFAGVSGFCAMARMPWNRALRAPG